MRVSVPGIWIIGVLFTAIALSCAAPAATGVGAAPIDTTTIAVLTYSDTFFTTLPKGSVAAKLSYEELQQVDRLLRAAINERNAKISSKELKYRGIDLGNYSYCRQYVAVLTPGGDKLVWIKCFSAQYAAYSTDWKRVPFHAEDGGNSIFEVTINLTTKKWHGLAIGGYA